jgi:hypothetical protein
MSKGLNTALVVGGLAALGLLAYNNLKGSQARQEAGVGALQGAIDFITSPFENNPSDTTPSSAQGGSSEATPRNYINDVLDQLIASGKASVSPLEPGYTGQNALDVNEQGLFVNRATGEVYPIDPRTGRQVRGIDEKGNPTGGYIANTEGVPYGSYTYQEIPPEGLKKYYTAEELDMPTGQELTVRPLVANVPAESPYKNVLVTSKATGISQAALVGTNPSTGEAWTFYRSW